MGLKKYDEKEVQAKVEQEEAQLEVETVEEKSELESIIDENSKEWEALQNLDPDENQKIVWESIEKARNEYFAFSKKQKTVSNIVAGIVLLLMIGSMVLVFTLGQQKGTEWVSYLALGLMLLTVIGSFVVTKTVKGKLGIRADEYIKVLFENVDGYLYGGEDFKDLAVKTNGQIKDEIFMDCRFYKNLKNTKSRNLVSVKYKDKELAIADLAGNILVKNRLSPMFLGRFYDYTSNYDKEDKRITIQIKGSNLSRPIDDVDDLKLVEGNSTYAIYTNDDEWRKVLTQKVLKDITQLKIDKILIDVIISIRKGKCSIGIDYVDEFMNIPVEKEFDFKNVKRSEHDLQKVLTIFDDLN